MAYIGKSPTAAPLTSSDVTDGIITNAKLAQDIISADTALGAEPADTDEFLVSDAGVLKRMDYSHIKGGGKVLQVVSATDGTERSTTSTSWVTASSTLTLDITPSATSSKILLLLSTNIYINANDATITIFRDSTNLGHADYGFSYLHITADYTHPTIIELDSPSSTSQITYAMYIRNISGSSTVYAGKLGAKKSLVAMEIGA